MTKQSYHPIRRGSPLWLTMTALLMGMNIILSSLRIEIGIGGIYLNNIVINVGAILLDPIAAFLIGGVGAFLGDAIFYPLPMFVSLVVHGLQAVAVSLISRKVLQEKRVLSSSLAVAVGCIITVIGYTLGRAYIYATDSAMIVLMQKMLLEVIQSAACAVIAIVLLFPMRLEELFYQAVHGSRP